MTTRAATRARRGAPATNSANQDTQAPTLPKATSKKGPKKPPNVENTQGTDTNSIEPPKPARTKAQPQTATTASTSRSPEIAVENAICLSGNLAFPSHDRPGAMFLSPLIPNVQISYISTVAYRSLFSTAEKELAPAQGAPGPRKSKRDKARTEDKGCCKEADKLWEKLEQRDAQAVQRQLDESPLVLVTTGTNAFQQSEDDYEEINMSNISPSTSEEDEAVRTTLLNRDHNNSEIEELSTDDDNDDAKAVAILQAQIQAIQLKKRSKPAKVSKPGPPSSTLPLASGLREEFRHDDARPTTVIPTAKAGFGGLQDDDIEDSPPQDMGDGQPSLQQNVASVGGILQRDPSRGNTNVAMLAPALHNQVPPPTHSIFRHPPPLVPAQLLRRTQAVQQTNPIPEAGSTASNTQPKGKKPKGCVKVADLPSFATTGREWVLRYLPSLTQTLFTSSKLFSDFREQSSTFRDTCQVLVRQVFPRVVYEVGPHGDKVVALSYARVNERRGRIVKDALDMIQKHVKDTFTDEINAASLPAGSLALPAHVPRPSGRFQSQFAISLLKTSLKRMDGSVLKDRQFVPIGLGALILTALKRAATSVRPDGTLIPGIPDFSYDNSGSTCDGWVRTLKSILQQKWQEILELGEPERLHTPPRVTGNSLIDYQRATLFNFESPAKGSQTWK
ncbi:hypothetical protein FA13DRAFT_1706017 [Coprinellus micaceus]|uniref:Uncharacterized protein n=1 Tax=Coprinellus micaceus TaxID=71717 RepID=A0A4Y7TRG5_COPMI|nr:hypothetical protein FA13DRAFT_1706017 [Coprinellus micaceus]